MLAWYANAPLPLARLMLPIAAAVLLYGGLARGAEPAPRALAGVAACTLIEGSPDAIDPIRRARPFRAAFSALDRAGSAARANKAALGRFERALDRLMGQARRVFHPEDPAALDREAARAFLERYVFGRKAVLRIGEERFEPRPEIATAMALAACRAGEPGVAVRLARRLTGAQDAPLRSLAALLLLDMGRPAEAAELAGSLGEAGFLGPWVGAELTDDPAERRRLHALAARRVSTPDQRTAVAEQRRRHGLAP